jgi:hypothetical protein
MGRREVPDSEDEPMTSSPVNTSDAAADKLFATARVPLQDAQDALQEATDTHQATAGSIANVPGKGCEGLDADQHDASTDVDASKDVSNELRPELTTSSQRQSTEAGNTADPQLLRIASPPEVRFDHVDAQHFAANTSSDGQHEAKRDLTAKPHATTASDTIVTPSASNVDLPHDIMSGQTPSDIAPHEGASERVNQQSSSEGTNDARQSAGPTDDQPNAGEKVIDSTGDQPDHLLAHAESLGDDLDVKHSVCLRSLYTAVRVLTCYLDEATGCAWHY